VYNAIWDSLKTPFNINYELTQYWTPKNPEIIYIGYQVDPNYV